MDGTPPTPPHLPQAYPVLKPAFCHGAGSEPHSSSVCWGGGEQLTVIGNHTMHNGAPSSPGQTTDLY